jgi:hypothetical protein
MFECGESDVSYILKEVYELRDDYVNADRGRSKAREERDALRAELAALKQAPTSPEPSEPEQPRLNAPAVNEPSEPVMTHSAACTFCDWKGPDRTDWNEAHADTADHDCKQHPYRVALDLVHAEIGKTLHVPDDIEPHIKVRMLVDMLTAQKPTAPAPTPPSDLDQEIEAAISDILSKQYGVAVQSIGAELDRRVAARDNAIEALRRLIRQVRIEIREILSTKAAAPRRAKR